jgi:hypothetical protein
MNAFLDNRLAVWRGLPVAQWLTNLRVGCIPCATSPSYNRTSMGWDEVMDEFLADLPPPPEKRRRILEPLTERQLARSFRQVRLDRHDHVIAKHSKTAYPLPWHAVGLMETLAEEPKAHDWRPIFITAFQSPCLTTGRTSPRGTPHLLDRPRTTSAGSCGGCNADIPRGGLDGGIAVWCRLAVRPVPWHNAESAHPMHVEAAL